ncbi:hypothetical protein CRE_00649 [Caenorhabditis remanei]|uniref:Uncharacterized protein n=1 Tax=Caenorhabditis remanei TaxID=31234 RepID=E3LDL9_CAERE|nr:hypothetical protein CRE_00649 [Caenorhabditis remanei]
MSHNDRPVPPEDPSEIPLVPDHFANGWPEDLMEEPIDGFVIISKWCVHNNIDAPRRLSSYARPLYPESIPRFKSLNDFHEYTRSATVKRKLVLEQARFISEKYVERRTMLSKNISRITANLWSVVPEREKRVEYANYVNFMMTYKEMYYWIGTVMESEFNNGLRSFASCEVIDAFYDYYPTVRSCSNSKVVDITNFTFLLYIRDRITTSLRDHYRILLPMLRREKVIEYDSRNFEKYQPFDYEWLAGSVVSGEYELAFAKFITIARMNQLEMSITRASIVAAEQEKELNFLWNPKTPFPRTPTDAKWVAESLQVTERRLRQDFVRCHKVIKTDGNENDDNVVYVTSLEQFNDFCGAVRVKKRKVMNTLFRAHKNQLKQKFRVIGLLATLDGLLLILQKVFGLYADKEKGLYGEAIPQIVLKAAVDVFKLTTEERCYRDTLDSEIDQALETLREKIHIAVKKFYTTQEMICEKHYTTVVPEGPASYQSFIMDISSDQFPPAIAKEAETMMWHLREQQKERFRLNRQLLYARHAPEVWPADEGIAFFRSNSCTGTSSFFSNLPFFVNPACIDQLNDVADNALGEVTPAKACGDTLFKELHMMMACAERAPTSYDVCSAFHAELKEELGSEQRVCGYTADILATILSRIVNTELEISNARNVYESGPSVLSSSLALLMAGKFVRTYLDYVCSNSKTTLRRSSEVCCSQRPRIPAPTVEEEPIMRFYQNGVEIEPPIYESESDYATDEGPDPRLERETDEELEDEEEEQGVEQQRGRRFDVNDAANIALLLNTLVDSNVLYFQPEEQLAQIPDELIDGFLSHLHSVHLYDDVDMTDPIFDFDVDE